MNVQMKRDMGQWLEGSQAQGSLSPWSWGCHPPSIPARGCTHPPRRSLNILFRASLDVSSRGHDWLLTQSPAPLPALKEGVSGWKSRFLILCGLSGDQPYPKLSRSPTEAILLGQKMLLAPHHSRNSKEFRSSVSRTKGRDQIHIFVQCLSIICGGRYSL